MSSNYSDDDLYLNAGESYQETTYYPDEPEEQIEERRTEAAIVSSSYPIIENVADWFKDQIKECDNIDNIAVSEVEFNGVKYSRTIHVEAQVLAYQLLKEKLSAKAATFGEFSDEVRQ